MRHEYGLQFRIRYYDYLLRQRLAGEYVFIHINKCGGTSVEAALGIPVKIHDTARLRRIKIGRRRWDKAFTFALVRHPYSRMISFHKYRSRYNQTGLRDRPLALNDWIRAVFRDRDPAYRDDPRMFASCFDWVSDGEAVIVKHVAKLEEIEVEWPILQARLGTDAALPLRNTSATGEKASPEGRGSWSALDPEARRLLETNFARDFEVFGYEP